MEIKIELDMNNIDYEAINKQIQEKVEALDIKEMHDVSSKIDYNISNLIEKEVEYSYNEYIDKYWKGHPTAEGRNLIKSMCKEEIENRVNKAIEEFFTEDIDENILREIMLKMLPDIFTYILFKKLENTLFSESYRYEEKMMNRVRSEIGSSLNSLKFNLQI